jgi:hypothetical protein
MLIILVAIVLIPQALTSPNITTLNGQIVQGENVTISGSGFGVKVSVAPLKYDDFEQGTPGEELSGWVLEAGANGPNPKKPRYSTTFIRPNSDKSAWCTFPSDINQWDSSFYYQSPEWLNEFYFDGWMLLEPPAINFSCNFKPFRVIGEVVGQETMGFTNLFNGNPEGGFTVGVGYPNYSLHFVDWLPFGYATFDHKWSHIQMYAKASSPDAEDGWVTLYLNGVKYVDRSYNTRTSTCIHNPPHTAGHHNFLWKTLWVGEFVEQGASGSCGPTGTTNTYWDNVYFDNTQARIEIGNNQIYDNCTHREIQIPHTTWTDTTIHFTTNLGSFNTSEQLYLFVVDENGNASEGFPLSLFENNSAPTILSVNTTLEQRKSIRITGRNFGVKNPAAPLLWDTLSNQPAYSGLHQGDVIPTGTSYPWRSNAHNVSYWTLDPHAYGQRYYHLAQSQGVLLGHDYGLGPTDKFFVNWWVRYSDDIVNGNNGAASTKLIRIWPDDIGTNGRISWCGSHTTYGRYDGIHGGGWNGTYGKWNKVEVQIDNEGYLINQSKYMATTNGIVIHNVSDLSAAFPYDRIYLIGLDPSYPENLDNVTGDFTDIYVDKTFARIVLGDAPIYENVRHGEMQIPVSWDAHQIEFTANLGSFEGLEQVYLFVIDANGTASQGYPVDISQTPAIHCGDGLANMDEECDGTDYKGETCESLGYDAGILSCHTPGSADECMLNMLSCTPAQAIIVDNRDVDNIRRFVAEDTGFPVQHYASAFRSTYTYSTYAAGSWTAKYWFELFSPIPPGKYDTLVRWITRNPESNLICQLCFVRVEVNVIRNQDHSRPCHCRPRLCVESRGAVIRFPVWILQFL